MPEPEPADLIARARQIRRDAGVGFRAMAGQVGVTQSTLSRWERDRPPDPARPNWQGAAVKVKHWVAVLAVLDAASCQAAKSR